MKLKVKLLKWSAGVPVVMLNPKTANQIGVHIKDRVSIKTSSNNNNGISTIVDLVEGFVKENQVVISSEIKKIMNLKNNQTVLVNLSESPKSLDFIKKKLDGKKLSKKEIIEIIKDIVSNSLSEPEIALFVSAMYDNGMNTKETVYLVKAIFNSGSKLKFKNRLVADKHSIGGIPGNRTTPIVVSICASAGLIMPKSSSRAITSAAGTADVIETIAPVEFSVKEVKKIIKKTNACLIWGGGKLNIVPADSRIINVEKILNIDPQAQLLASIMAKKIAMGAKYILIDIPYGKNAKVNKEKAEELRDKFYELGKIFKKKVKVILNEIKGPMGVGVGPALELIDVINVLDPRKKGPKKLEERSIDLAAEVLEMTGKAEKGDGLNMAKRILYSGRAFKKFKQIIKAQNGNFKKLRVARFKKDIFSKKSGIINEININKVNLLARIAGCPTDKFAGINIYISIGDKIKKNTKLITLYSESKSRLKESIKFYNKKNPIKIK